MGWKGHSEEEIPCILREAESGETVGEVSRKPGVGHQSFSLWKKYAGLGLSELRELRQLREGNGKLKHLVAEPRWAHSPAYVSFYRDQKTAMELPPIAVTTKPATRLGVVPLKFEVPLGKLEPGWYQCQGTVLDPAGHRAAFWQGPIKLVR